jgi:hypothetical protein
MRISSVPRRTAVTAAVTLAVAGAGTVALVGSAGAASGQAHPKPKAPTCSLGTLHGTYLFRGDGIHTNADGSTQAMAYAGSFHFDGAGNIDRGYITTRVARFLQSDRALDGSTYTLGANCTGTFTINNPAHFQVVFDIFVSPTGNKFTYIQTDNGDQYDVDATVAERVTLG